MGVRWMAAGLGLAAGLAALAAGPAGATLEQSALVSSCVKDQTTKGKPEAQATTDCVCAVTYIKDRLTEKEYAAFEMIVPMMEQSPEGPTPEMLAELTQKAGLTAEEFDVLGQKVSSVGPEADQACGTQ